jgi:hypothetical protein
VGRRFPIFLTPKASRENISGTIGHTAAREKAAIGARRQSGALLWRGGAVIFVRSASRRLAVSQCCHYTRKQKKSPNPETQSALKIDTDEIGTDGNGRERDYESETGCEVPPVYRNKSSELPHNDGQRDGLAAKERRNPFSEILLKNSREIE